MNIKDYIEDNRRGVGISLSLLKNERTDFNEKVFAVDEESYKEWEDVIYMPLGYTYLCALKSDGTFYGADNKKDWDLFD